MRVSTHTQLSLFEYAQIMGISEFEMAQIGAGFPKNSTAQCQTVWFQEAWQRDFVSREEAAKAISEAEFAIAEQLGYWPAPRYFVDERVPYPRPYKRWLYGHALTERGDWKSVDVQWKKVIGGGVFNRTVVDNSVVAPKTVTQSDPDGDGINERFTVTGVTTVTDPNELAIYFKAADRLSAAVDETWRIRPVNVAISGGSFTITGHTSQLVIPKLTTVTNPVVLDVTQASTFVTEVEVYRVFRDTTATESTPFQGVAVWDVLPGCDGVDCQFEIKAVCIAERLNVQGQVGVQFGLPQDWPQPWREPDYLRLNYAAGLPLENGRMERQHARMVAYLATALLPSDKCGCDRSHKIIHFWRRMAGEGDDGRQYTEREINENPFGEPRVGALWAWRRVRDLQRIGAVSV